MDGARGSKRLLPNTEVVADPKIYRGRIVLVGSRRWIDHQFAGAHEFLDVVVAQNHEAGCSFTISLGTRMFSPKGVAGCGNTTLASCPRWPARVTCNHAWAGSLRLGVP